MGMLLFFQLFHVSLMVHWCMIGPVLHLLLSYHWSAQAVRYWTNKQIDHAIFKFLSFCTEDFPCLMNKIFCLYILQTYFFFVFFSLSLSLPFLMEPIMCFTSCRGNCYQLFFPLFTEWVLRTVGSGMWGDFASFNSLQSPNIQDGTTE